MSLPRLLLACIFVVASRFVAAADFQRDIQPILAEHCAQCHGADEKERKSGLRLDQRDAALKGGESGTAAIVPGKLDQGELIRRITSTNPDEVMPPPDHKKPLSATQIETIKQWIKDGANYESHWAFAAPKQAAVPAMGMTSPIDAFVASRLKERKLSLSPAAAPATLCRRLYLDLIGLPPSPQELADFEKDGYEAT